MSSNGVMCFRCMAHHVDGESCQAALKRQRAEFAAEQAKASAPHETPEEPHVRDVFLNALGDRFQRALSIEYLDLHGGRIYLHWDHNKGGDRLSFDVYLPDGSKLSRDVHNEGSVGSLAYMACLRRVWRYGSATAMDYWSSYSSPRTHIPLTSCIAYDAFASAALLLRSYHDGPLSPGLAAPTLKDWEQTITETVDSFQRTT